MPKNENMLNSQLEENDTLNIREELEKYLIHWKWFFIGAILSLIFGYIYLRYTAPQYSASATILIKDNQKSGISKELEAFKDMGIVGGGSTNNTDNEIEIIKSRKIIGKVVDSLNLDINYYIEGRVIKSERYNKKPIRFDFISKDVNFFNKDTVLIVSQKSATDFSFLNEKKEIVATHKFDEIIKSKIGTFRIEKLTDNKKDIFIVLNKKSEIIDFYRKNVSISPVNKKSSVLVLSIENGVQDKAEDFLDELVKQYNIDAINDKSQVSKKTRDFIDERLHEIHQDLAIIQDDVESYKIKNKITGLSKEGELALETASKNTVKLTGIKGELILAKSVFNSLEEDSSENQTLPQNLGFSDVNIGTSIAEYNQLVLSKSRLTVNAGAKNPQVIQYTSEIEGLKVNLKRSISNLISSLKTEQQTLQSAASVVTNKISAIPVLERGFIDIARQQQIISSLYEYLLKKKEETAISLAVTVPNAKIIDVAYSTGIPVSPKRKIVYLACLLLGLIIPFTIIYIKNLLDTKFHSRKDIEALITVPFIGDVPHSETNEKIVIGNDSRTSAAEAFRLIRTNLDFMLPNKDNGLGKTIFITSTTSGEGKSFISINLAAALSLSSKKVLLLGMDLRAPKVTEYLGIPERKGITNYITNESISLDDVKFSIPEIKGLDIIASGVIPPNPAELLLNSKIKDLFDEVKKDYDYIIVDTAPVNLVTDTLLVAKYADLFLYVSRANYLDKRMLHVPQTLYNEKKLPNMAIVLNDTDMTRGYGYGYGYGYGNGYVEDVKKPWYKRILS